MGRPKKLDKEFRDFRQQYIYETIFTDKLIKNQSFYAVLLLVIFIGACFLMLNANTYELKRQISNLDMNLGYQNYQYHQLEVKLNEIEAKLNASQPQVVPFCKLTASNGQVGVGIQPEKLNETCE